MCNSPLELWPGRLDCSHPYFAERGINQQTVIDFHLGFSFEEIGTMTSRIVIPIHNVDGEVVSYAGRWPGEPPAGIPKYLFRSGFKKELELFNVDRAIRERPDKPLVIVEGFFDVIKFHQHGYRKVVALMGSSMSTAQEELIREQGTGRAQIIIMLDEDEAGRIGREDIASRLSKFCFVKVHVFRRPDAQPEGLSAEELEDILGFAL